MCPAATTDEPDLRARRHERAREDILDAAWRLAERDGIAGISLRELAEAVGMRAPSLYTYFDSKGAIYDAMFAQGYRQLDELMSGLEDATEDEGSAESDGGDARELMIRGLERWLRFCQASLPRYQLMFTRVLPDWEPSAEAYAASRASYARMASAYARMGLNDPAHLDLWTALSAGLAAQQLANEPHGERWVRLAPTAVDMFLQHVRGADR